MNLNDMLKNAYSYGADPKGSNAKKSEFKKVSIPVFPTVKKEESRPEVNPGGPKVQKNPVSDSFKTIRRDKPSGTTVSGAFSSSTPASRSFGTEKPFTKVNKQISDILTNNPKGLIKVLVATETKDGTESMYRRVAKFLLLIGENEAAKILPHLSEEQIEKIVPEIATIRSVESDEAEEILNEFKGLIEKSREDGGVSTARNILEKAFGSEKAESLLEKAVPFTAGKPFEYLYEADNEKIIQLLSDESPAVQTLVLSYLPPKKSAAVIQSMKEENRKDVILRLAKLKEINPEVLKRVDQSMHEKNNALVTEKSDHIDGRSSLAQILKQMSPDAEEKLMATLSSSDPELGADLRDRLFTQEDIINADDRYLQNYLRGMSDGDIAVLIAGKDDEFRKKILHNVSQNRSGAILEEEQVRKPIRKSDAEKITSAFFASLRRAWEDGELIIKGRDSEIYV